jgi:hypothetical protein
MFHFERILYQERLVVHSGALWESDYVSNCDHKEIFHLVENIVVLVKILNIFPKLYLKQTSHSCALLIHSFWTLQMVPGLHN